MAPFGVFCGFSFDLGHSRSARQQRQNETKSVPVTVALIGAALMLTPALLSHSPLTKTSQSSCSISDGSVKVVMPTVIEPSKDSSGAATAASTKRTRKKCPRKPSTGGKKRFLGVSPAAPESKKKNVAADFSDGNATDSKNQSIPRKMDEAEARLKSPPENEGKLAASQAARPADGISEADKRDLYPQFYPKQLSEASTEAPRKAAPKPKEAAPEVAPKKSAAKTVSSAALKGRKEEAALIQQTEYKSGVFNRAGWCLYQALEPTFKTCAGQCDFVALESKMTTSLLWENQTIDDCQFFVVDMRSENTQAIDKICEMIVSEFDVTQKKVLTGTATSNHFAFVFGEGDAKEKTLCSVLAVATVNVPHNGEEPTIVDYLVVAKTFRKKGLGRALLNCAMIMGLAKGREEPEVWLVTEVQLDAYKVYTQKYGFVKKTWGSLPRSVRTWAEDAGYVDHKDEAGSWTRPLLRKGLLVQRNTSHRICRVAITDATLLQAFSLNEDTFAQLIQDKGKVISKAVVTRPAQYVCPEGKVYEDVWLAASGLCRVALMACDNFQACFPKRPNDSAKSTQMLAKQILDLRVAVKRGRNYALSQEELLKWALKEWGADPKEAALRYRRELLRLVRALKKAARTAKTGDCCGGPSQPAEVQVAESTLKSTYNKETHDNYLLSYKTSKISYKGVNILSNRAVWNSVQTPKHKKIGH